MKQSRFYIRPLLFALFVAVMVAAGCGGGGDSTMDASVKALVQSRGLTGNPAEGFDQTSIESPLARLGMNLFFSTALGGDFDSACVSCHHPALGGGDGLSLSVGVGADDPVLLGPGRLSSTNGFLVPRNAPTTFNAGLFQSVLFWDGRVETLDTTGGRDRRLQSAHFRGDDGQRIFIRTPDSDYGVADPLAGDSLLEAQSRFPVTSDAEMRGFAYAGGEDNESLRQRLAARLGGYGQGAGELGITKWLKEFQEAFESTDGAETLIVYENIAVAIAAYEDSQLFIDNPWFAYLKGGGSVSAAAKRGAMLFYTDASLGGANCYHCHSGDFFTDEGFYTMATPQIGVGKGDGDTGDDDFGRYRETGNDDDLYAFRVPSLLNVEVTGPYGHAGAYTELKGIVRHMLDPETAFNAYDYSQLDPMIPTYNTDTNTAKALSKLAADRDLGKTPHEIVTLTDSEVDDLVEFLLSLTDPCVKSRECLLRWVPGSGDSNPDGFRLVAEDFSGAAL